MSIINNFYELKERIHSKGSLSVIRLGNVEMTSLLQKEGIYNQMFSNAGFYCNDDKKLNEIYLQWKNAYVSAIYNCDLMLDVVTCSSFQIQGDLMNKLNIWKPSLVYIEDPRWWIENIIMEYEGTIGIVSYFKKDIERQLKVLNKVWNKKLNKKFIIVKSENSISGNYPHNNWTETFNDLKKRVLKEKEPDLWLVSCGCYGVPLCDEIATNRKKAIYVGGLLQLFFGLKGKRWDQRQDVIRSYNEYWTYPTEKPVNAEKVEGWCYGDSK